MEGDNYVKILPGVGTIIKNVTNVYDKQMEGDNYVKDSSGVNVVTTLRKDMDKDENPMEGDNTIRCPPGVSSGTLKTCGTSDSMEGDENIKFLPDSKTTINASFKPMEGENYVKDLPRVGAVTKTVKIVKDSPMKEDNYIKGYIPGVNTVPNSNEAHDTTYWLDSCGNDLHSVHDITDWLDSCTQNTTSSFGFLFSIFVLSCIMINVNCNNTSMPSTGHIWVDNIETLTWNIGIEKENSHYAMMKEFIQSRKDMFESVNNHNRKSDFSNYDAEIFKEHQDTITSSIYLKEERYETDDSNRSSFSEQIHKKGPKHQLLGELYSYNGIKENTSDILMTDYSIDKYGNLMEANRSQMKGDNDAIYLSGIKTVTKSKHSETLTLQHIKEKFMSIQNPSPIYLKEERVNKKKSLHSNNIGSENNESHGKIGLKHQRENSKDVEVQHKIQKKRLELAHTTPPENKLFS